MTTPAEPPRIDWFPGVHTGPAVGVGLTRSEIEVLRHMIEDTPQFITSNVYAAKLVLRDLDVRVGAIGELDASGTNEIVLRSDEHTHVRAAYEEYAEYRSKSPRYREVNNLIVDLDRRLGAAQIRLAQSGMMTEDDFPNRIRIVDDEEWFPPRQGGAAEPRLLGGAGRWRPGRRGPRN